jgi:CubicO group peptidase (beta-lactamase class C family)
MTPLAEPLEALTRSLVTDGDDGRDALAAVALVGTATEILATAAAGSLGASEGRDDAVATVETRFDLASLTKPFLATLALRLDADRTLPVATRIGKVWPQAAPELAERTLEDLLRHRSGLQPWTPLYAQRRRPEDIPRVLLGEELLGAEVGQYSDLGYILWALTARRVLRAPVAALLQEWVTEPLELTTVAPSPGGIPGVAACPLTTAREVQLAARVGLSMAVQPPPARGQVQDGNARFLSPLEAVPGHAGLFAAAADVWRLAAAWLAPDGFLQPTAVAAALAGDGPYALGWQRRGPGAEDSAATPLGADAFGHFGFTGTSVWIDPASGRIAILLAHRTSPFRDLTPARRALHRVMLQGR